VPEPSARSSDPRSALLRRPRRVLGVAIVCIAVLGLLGKNVESRLVTSTVEMPGTESSRAESRIKTYFGDSAPFAILLRGPAPQLDRQGPQLIQKLHHDPTVTTLSPWDRGSVGDLRPSPEAALIVVDFHAGVGKAVGQIAPHLDALVKTDVSPPVTATATGFPIFLAGTKEAADEAGQRGELIALPILLVVLLLVFRSPVAACVPIFFGVATVIGSRGVIAILSRWVNIDPIGPPAASMMGLALGVDYALLMVSRFREELSATTSPMLAATETRRTAGRTILIAGSTLLSSLIVAFLVLPKGPFTSLDGAVVVTTVLSILMAWTVGPAVLTLLGSHIDRWRIGGARPQRTRLMTLVQGVLRRPGPTAVAIVALMLIAAGPLLSLATGSSAVEQLPSSSPVRRDAELISRVAGPGWAAPFTVVVSTEHGSIAQQGRLDALARWQREIAAEPGVKDVIGPGPIARKVRPLRKQGNDLIAGGSHSKLAATQHLGRGLDRAADGVSRLRFGLVRGSQGAGLLGEGSKRAAQGALALAHGVDEAATGGSRATDAIDQVSEGTQRLVSGQRSVRFGGLQLELGLTSLLPDVAKRGLGQARPLQADLARRAAGQPELQEDADRAARLVTQFARAKREVQRLRKESAKLYSGLSLLASGGTKLQAGIARLSRASQGIGGGLKRLGGGSRQLAAGVSRLSGGAATLERKLAEGYHRSYPLQSGLQKSSVKVSAQSRSLNRSVKRLRESSPGLFDSGYFALSVLDGAPLGNRKNVNQVVDVAQGGKAARLLVIGNRRLNSAGDVDLYADLQRRAGELERTAHVDVAVGGGSAQLIDYGRFASRRLPLLILMVTAATFLMLVVFLRSLLLSAIAVSLNLVTVAVSFGMLSLIGHIPPGYPLGGNRVLDVGAAMLIFTVAFSLSIDYAVFLVTRMREAYDEGDDHARAIYVGLEKTARVVTGAAVVMGAVFMAYASAPLVLMSQIGTGLAIAVLLDATVIRIVLLPALMLLVGDRVWWLPASLARLLPRFEAH
jgi:putative drug exporter of the RND superfamily